MVNLIFLLLTILVFLFHYWLLKITTIVYIDGSERKLHVLAIFAILHFLILALLGIFFEFKFSFLLAILLFNINIVFIFSSRYIEEVIFTYPDFIGKILTKKLF